MEDHIKSRFYDTISILLYWQSDDKSKANNINILLKSSAGKLSLPRCEASSGLWYHDAQVFIKKVIPDYSFSKNDMKMIYQLRLFIPSSNSFVHHIIFALKLENFTDNVILHENDFYKVMTREELCSMSSEQIERRKIIELINKIDLNDLNVKVDTVIEELHPRLIDLYRAEVYKGAHRLSKILQAPGYSKKDLHDLYDEFVSRCYPYSSLVLNNIKDLLANAGWPSNEKHVFRSLDVDQCGELNLKQFLLGMVAMDPLTQHGDVTGEHRCKYIFRLYDKDNDNYMDESDIVEMVKDIYTLQKGIQPTDEVINTNIASALSVFGISCGEQLTLDLFLQAVGSLRYRGTSLLFRASNSIPILLMKMKNKFGVKKRVRSISEGEASDKGKKRLLTDKASSNAGLNIITEETRKNDLMSKNVSYSLAEHTVKVRRTGCITNVDNLLDMERAGELCNTGLDVDDMTMTDQEEVLSNFGVPIIYNTASKNSQGDFSYLCDTTNYRKKVSKQFSAQAFNVKSLPNEILIALNYFEHRSNDKPPYEWGQVDMMKMGRYLISLCDFLQDIFEQEPRLLTISPPCYVLGDLHGNYEDLVCFEKTLWRLGPHLTPASFLFLGDYVDRGAFGVEVVAYLFAQKLRAPAHFHLLRGNHEVRELQKNFTFYNECISKFGNTLGEQLWEKINEVFDRMPLAAVVGRKIFCMHGGIPGMDISIDPLFKIPCPLPDPENQSQVAWQLMWNDPVAAEDLNPEIKKQLTDNSGFAFNEKRQTGCIFNETAFDCFLEKNQISHVIRAHEVKQAGFEIQQAGRLLTVFSSSRYCGGSNEAACILINDYRIRIIRLDTSKSF